MAQGSDTTELLTKGVNVVWTSTLGWTGRPDGKRVSFDCNKATIDFAGVTGKEIPLDVTNVTFQGPVFGAASRCESGSGNSVVMLRDANGKPRLVLKVTPASKASIDFLDANSKVRSAAACLKRLAYFRSM